MARKTPQNPYGLTLKQRKWYVIYLETGNQTEAARRVYNCKSDATAWKMGSQLVRKLAVPIADLMDDMGISDGKIYNLLQSGLTATKSVTIRKEGKGTTKEDVPDLAMRLRYLELAMRAKGQLVNKVQHQDGDGNVIGPVILPAIPDVDPKTPQLPDVDPKQPIKAPGGAQA